MTEQPDECQALYLAMVERLEQDGYLVEPFAKKLDKELFEMRVRRGRQVRVLYCYEDGDVIIGLHAFVKKTQKLQQKELKQAKRMLLAVRNGDYDE